MLDAVLRDFKAAVTERKELFLDTLYFVAEDDGDFRVAELLGIVAEGVEFDTVVNLLYGKDFVALLLELADTVGSFLKVLPVYAVFGTEGGFVDVAMRRGGADAAEADLLDTKCIGSAEDRANVVLTADVVQYDGEGQFLCLFEFLNRDAVQFLHAKLFHV